MNNELMKAEAMAVIENPVVIGFLRQQALEKVAAEMQSKGRTCTSKGVEILAIKHDNIAARVAEYLAAGVVGALMAKHGAA